MPLRISKLEKALRENPGIPLFARVADEHLRRGRVSRALALCQEGCERFPDYPTGFLLLGRCYQVRGNFEEARNFIGLALRLDPENSAGFAALSEAYEQLGEISLALQCMRQAAFLDPYSEDLDREAERLRRRSAAAPLVLPPGPTAVTGVEVRKEPREETGEVEAETEAVPPPGADWQAPSSSETAGSFAVEPDMDRGSNGEPPREDTEEGGLPVSGRPAVAAVEPEPPEPVPREEPVYPDDRTGTGQEDPGNADADVPDAVEAPLVQTEEEGGEVPAPANGMPPEEPPLKEAPSADSSLDAPPFGDTEGRQTGVFYFVPEPERMGAGDEDPPRGLSEDGLEPEAPPASQEEAAVPPGGDVTAPDDAGPERPVAWLSGPGDHELIGLLSEIGTGEEKAPGPDPEAGGEEQTAPVPTATLAELYIQQGIASKGIEIYRDLLRLHPDDDEIRARLGGLEEHGGS